MLADCQTFYASVEKADHPELRDKPLVVAGNPAIRSGIVLAACPIAKSRYGITTAERLGDALKKCPELVVMRPRMQHYINVSLMISKIYQEYTDQVEVFSIDEQFLDVSGSLSLFGDPEVIAAAMQQKVLKQTGVWIRVGISSTKVLAKMATDIWAKKNESGIFTLRKPEISQWLWNQPVAKMYGVGSRMNRHLNSLGLYTIGDVANTPLGVLKLKFRAHFGKQSDIQAEVMWRTANGLDDSPVSPGTFSIPPKSVGHMMTLPRDYTYERDINTVLLELTEEVCSDCRRRGYLGSVVSVSCMCSPYDAPTGFSRQMKLPDASSHTNTVYEAAKQLFYRYWNGMPVRRIGLTLSGLSGSDTIQLTLFEDQPRQQALDLAVDEIKARYGSAAVLRASSLNKFGQALERSQKIGGHYK